MSGTVIQQWMRKIPFLRKGGLGSEERAESGKWSCDCKRFCQCFLCPEEDRVDKHDRRLIWIGEKLERLEGRLGESRVEDETKTPCNRNLRGSSTTPPQLSDSSPFPGRLPSSTPNNALERDCTVPEIRVSSEEDHPESSGQKRKEDSKGFEQGSFCGGSAGKKEEKTPEETTERGIPGSSAGGHLERGKTSFDSGDSLLTDSGDPDNKQRVSKNEWMNVEYLKAGQCDVLDEVESQFWSGFMEEYLKPIHKSEDEEAKIVVGLRKLRNNIAFSILVANGLLVLIIYLLQNNKEILSVEVTPYENYTWQKYDPTTGSLETVTEPLLVEPIGLTIIIFLSLILGVQTLGMLIHRFHTASHVLASTVLSCFKRRKTRVVNGDKELEEHAVDIARNLQKLDDEYDNFDADLMSPRGRKRKVREEGRSRDRRRNQVVYNIEEAKKRRQKVRGLHSAFQKRFLGFNPHGSRKRHQAGSQQHLHGDPRIVVQGTDLYAPEVARQVATAEAFRRRRENVLREETITRAPSRLRSHLSQPGRAVALHSGGGGERGPSPIFGGRTGKTGTFLDEINLELRRAAV